MPARVDFWSRVSPEPNTGCWLWLGPYSHNGYGRCGEERANRVALSLRLGRQLRSDEEAAHKCDVRCCVNPDHLFPATHQQNEDDKKAKGRQARGAELAKAQAASRPRGETHGMTKLTDAQVLEIRARHVCGSRGSDSTSALAKEYGVDRTLIWMISTKRIHRVVGLG
jgi:hypothetical protein